jgi:hypothetical protein
MNTKYLPVDPDYSERFEQAISEKKEVAVFYFGEGNSLNNVNGKPVEIISSTNHEEFLEFQDGFKIRLDRIIVFDGNPGPAYDEYDSYALACLDCTGGMD